jgi:hypothetical protein
MTTPTEPTATDPITGENWTALEFLQHIRSDLGQIKENLGITPPPPPVTKTGSYPTSGQFASNPKLATDATGWVLAGGGSAQRVAVNDHVAADYALEVTLNQANAIVYCPTGYLAGFGHARLAVDVQVSVAATVQTSGASASSDGQVGGFESTSVPADGAWHRVQVDVYNDGSNAEQAQLVVAFAGLGAGATVRLTLADYVHTS